MSRISSGYSCSPNTGIGSSAAADWTVDRVCADLDLAGREVGIDRLRRAGDDLAIDRDTEFHPDPVERLERRRIRVGDDLRNSVMIPQVDEQQMPMVALAMHPARKANGLADIAATQFGAVMGTIGVHDEVGSLSGKLWGKARAALQCGAKHLLSTREGAAKAPEDSCVSIH